MADLGEIIKRHELEDFSGCYSDMRDAYPLLKDAHADRAALIALLKEAHEALRPFAAMWNTQEFPHDGFGTECPSCHAAAYSYGDLNKSDHTSNCAYRQAARILAGTE